jgi:hypothetical protein
MRMTVLAAAGLMNVACRSEHRSEGKLEAKTAAITWRPLGSWSGRGDAQTESFEIGFEQFRIRWETRNETSPGAGTFNVSLNSAVSGRILAQAVEHNGVGHDIAYVSVEPHFSYLVIESSGVDWSITAEEPGPSKAVP